eukprot:GDKJ01050035.1.p1 GENE.GDKJ01050035.1~~GDKJ01050035.1.p1  ORF type:complete len:868 (-),score=185.18 GDKJ01050035.1:34-2301(-)
MNFSRHLKNEGSRKQARNEFYCDSLNLENSSEVEFRDVLRQVPNLCPNDSHQIAISNLFNFLSKYPYITLKTLIKKTNSTLIEELKNEVLSETDIVFSCDQNYRCHHQSVIDNEQKSLAMLEKNSSENNQSHQMKCNKSEILTNSCESSLRRKHNITHSNVQVSHFSQNVEANSISDHQQFSQSPLSSNVRKTDGSNAKESDVANYSNSARSSEIAQESRSSIHRSVSIVELPEENSEIQSEKFESMREKMRILTPSVRFSRISSSSNQKKDKLHSHGSINGENFLVLQVCPKELWGVSRGPGGSLLVSVEMKKLFEKSAVSRTGKFIFSFLFVSSHSIKKIFMYFVAFSKLFFSCRKSSSLNNKPTIPQEPERPKTSPERFVHQNDCDSSERISIVDKLMGAGNGKDYCFETPIYEDQFGSPPFLFYSNDSENHLRFLPQESSRVKFPSKILQTDASHSSAKHDDLEEFDSDICGISPSPLDSKQRSLETVELAMENKHSRNAQTKFHETAAPRTLNEILRLHGFDDGPNSFSDSAYLKGSRRLRKQRRCVSGCGNWKMGDCLNIPSCVAEVEDEDEDSNNVDVSEMRMPTVLNSSKMSSNSLTSTFSVSIAASAQSGTSKPSSDSANADQNKKSNTGIAKLEKLVNTMSRLLTKLIELGEIDCPESPSEKIVSKSNFENALEEPKSSDNILLPWGISVECRRSLDYKNQELSLSDVSDFCFQMLLEATIKAKHKVIEERKMENEKCQTILPWT